MAPAQTEARYTLWRYAAARRLHVALRSFFLGRVLLGLRAGVSHRLEADRTVNQSTRRRFEAADCGRPGSGDVRCVLDRGTRAGWQALASLLAILGGPRHNHRGQPAAPPLLADAGSEFHRHRDR